MPPPNVPPFKTAGQVVAATVADLAIKVAARELLTAVPLDVMGDRHDAEIVTLQLRVGDLRALASALERAA